MSRKIKTLLMTWLLLSSFVLQACSTTQYSFVSGGNNSSSDQVENIIPDESKYLFYGSNPYGNLPDKSEIKKIALSKKNNSDPMAGYDAIYAEIDFEKAKVRYGTNSGGRLDTMKINQEYDLTDEDMDRYRNAVNQSCLRNSIQSNKSWWKVGIEYEDGTVYSAQIEEEGYNFYSDENAMINVFFDKMDVPKRYEKPFGLRISKTESDNNVGDNEDKIVSVEKFMEYYNITEDEVPKDYIMDYIMEYRYREDSLSKWDLGTKVKNYYANGKVFGKDPGRIFQGEASQLPLDDYMNIVDVIQLDFSMRYGNELSSARIMTIDLGDKKVYFAEKQYNDYTQAEKSADLTEEEVQSIRTEFGKHIADNNGGVSNTSYDYSFIINMKATDYSSKFYRGESGDETNFPGFDEYWKELYKEKFGEEFEFSN